MSTVDIKDEKIYNQELQNEVDRVASKYEGCNDEFEQIGEEPKSCFMEKDTYSKTMVSDEEIVNILGNL